MPQGVRDSLRQPGRAGVDVRRIPPQTEHQPGMLHPAGTVHQLRSHCADIRLYRPPNEAGEPLGLEHFGIVVEEDEDAPVRQRCAAVAEGREVKRPWSVENADVGLLPELLEQLERSGLLAAIVNDHQFEIVRARFAQAGKAYCQKVGMIPRRNDERCGRLLLRHSSPGWNGRDGLVRPPSFDLLREEDTPNVPDGSSFARKKPIPRQRPHEIRRRKHTLPFEAVPPEVDGPADIGAGVLKDRTPVRLQFRSDIPPAGGDRVLVRVEERRAGMRKSETGKGGQREIGNGIPCEYRQDEVRGFETGQSRAALSEPSMHVHGGSPACDTASPTTKSDQFA